MSNLVNYKYLKIPVNLKLVWLSNFKVKDFQVSDHRLREEYHRRFVKIDRLMNCVLSSGRCCIVLFQDEAMFRLRLYFLDIYAAFDIQININVN